VDGVVVSDVGASLTEGVSIEIRKHLDQDGGYYVEVRMVKGSHEAIFTVSPARPVYSSSDDPDYEGTLDVRIRLLKDSLVRLAFDMHDLSLVTSESEAKIVDAYIEPYESGASDAELAVTIQNVGDIEADYVVTVTECATGVEQVVAQSAVLQSLEEAVLTFDLHKDGTFAAGETCQVTVMSTLGKVYDTVQVVFPAPNGG
jgi:hypothetical protein